MLCFSRLQGRYHQPFAVADNAMRGRCNIFSVICLQQVRNVWYLCLCKIVFFYNFINNGVQRL